MKSSEWKMILAGGAAWAAGTIYFFFRAADTFKHGPLVLWGTAAITILGYLLLFRRLLMKFKVEPGSIGWSALLFVLPGLTGEILALLNPTVLLPGMRPESVVTYAALLFAGYASMGYYALYRQARHNAVSSPQRLARPHW
jgi:hypothetical protein